MAIATLSLGTALGVSTAVFAVIDATRFSVSAYREPERLFSVRMFSRKGLAPTALEFEQALAAIPGVEQVATAYRSSALAELEASLEQVEVSYVRPGYFETLGTRPRLGRLPAADEPSRGDAAVVSDRLWRRRFANRGVIGDATITIGDRQYAVIGVLPAGTSGNERWVDAWVLAPDLPLNVSRFAVLRVRPGITAVQLRPRVRDIGAQFASGYFGPRSRPLEAIVASLRERPLQITELDGTMVGAAVCVLLIACANVAALMLARGVARRREYALRLALGASRGVIAREVVVEVALLALLGAVAGAILASWGVGLLARAMPDQVVLLGLRPPQWSLRVLAMSAAAVFSCVALAGAVPAWRAGATDPAGPLKESSGGSTGRVATRFRWLVIAELAIAMTVMVGASLLLKSIRRLDGASAGYLARGMLSVGVQFGTRRDTVPSAERARRLDLILERIRTMPGVRTAATFHQGCLAARMLTTENAASDSENTSLYRQPCHTAGPDFFRSLGLRMVAGREFSAGDVAAGGAVILDEKTARRLFPHESAVGRRVKFGLFSENQPWLPVVGVVRNSTLYVIRFPELGPDSSITLFVTPSDVAPYGSTIVVRPEPGARGVALEIGRALSDLLPPPSYSSSLRPWDYGYTSQRESIGFVLIVFATLGVMSLALGAAGLFSVVSYVASQRTREFAVRIALGATSSNVLRLVVRNSLELALGGTAFGALVGMWAGFRLWNWLYGVYPVDVGALLAAEGVLLAVTLAASLAPALRATRADPVEVLRAT